MKEHVYVTLFGAQVPLAVFLLFVALVTWVSFYLMDRFWYHRLLYGAVRQGIRIEATLEPMLPKIQLAKSIGDESPLRMRIFRKRFSVHSTTKMDVFYFLGGACVIGFMLALFFQG
jgi:hypothetical protein